MALIEVATVAEQTPLYLYGGRDGELGALYMSTGARQGGTSRIFKHLDRNGDSSWVEESLPQNDAETMAKIRDDGTRLYAFYETSGDNFLVSRLIAPGGTWAFEAGLPGDDFVGGRGLDALVGGDVYAGGSAEWNALVRRGELYQGEPGSWANTRTIEPGILWELVVRQDNGDVWEFWHRTHAPVPNGGPSTFLNGGGVNSPGDNISAAEWFPTFPDMFASGDHGGGMPHVKRYNGGAWSTVLTMDDASMAESLLYVPRGAGELWAVGQDPLQVYRTFNGTDWELILDTSLNTGTDTNNLCGVGYYCGRVWVAARDASAGLIRIFRENIPSRCGGGMHQVI